MRAVCLEKLPVLMILLCGIAFADAVSAQNFRIIDLGTLGGSVSAAKSLADDNTVVGWAETASGERHAFSTCPTCEMSDLGLLPGGSNSSATAISSSGNYIVGYSGINEFGIPFKQINQGFIISNNASQTKAGMKSSGALYCPCTFNTRYGFSEAFAVNNRGEVVGRSETVRGKQVVHAFLWKDGVIHDIGNGAGDLAVSSAYAINNVSQVAGNFIGSDTPEPNSRAFLWQNGSRQDLGVLEGHSSSSALAVNDAGMVVGWSGSLDHASSTAFLWHKGAMQNLGALPGDSNSRAMGINNEGQVVGISGADLSSTLPGSVTITAYGNPSESASDASAEPGASILIRARPFLWQNGAMLDLNSLLLPEDSEWLIIAAVDINNRGWIAGTGLIEGLSRAILLQPVNPVRQQRHSQNGAHQ